MVRAETLERRITREQGEVITRLRSAIENALYKEPYHTNCVCRFCVLRAAIAETASYGWVDSNGVQGKDKL